MNQIINFTEENLTYHYYNEINKFLQSNLYSTE